MTALVANLRALGLMADEAHPQPNQTGCVCYHPAAIS
jgi:hypothetical protein